MSDFNSLLDENPFVQKRTTEAEEKGCAQGIVEGEIKASQKAIVTIVRGRFPALTELAQREVTEIRKLDALDFLVEKVSTTPDDAVVRFLLTSSAA